MYYHYPNCQKHATHTWALVPVCWRHRERIMEKTLKYYWLGGKTKRPEYEKIRQYTPWGVRQ